mgnify:CR=1 FL=1
MSSIAILQSWLEALWFFVPISAANQSSGWARKAGLWLMDKPVSEKLFGTDKTVGAYYAAPLGAVATLYLQAFWSGVCNDIGLFDYQRSDLWRVGLMMGFGVVAGDYGASAIKRWKELPQGAPFWPVDQLNYVVVGIAFVSPIVWVGWGRAIFLLAFAFPLHYWGNQLGYWLRLRKVPY